ncbi:hypothetical protein [Mycolicibacterium mageritense]|uniref:Uncharacterized protein n=1 Tax=Mycolicibacterium mageritense TaxID=53462 RepID=A0ABN5Y7I1_MYCME|nr:hypothetical protein [Mycolicibacterium mageritense]BBX33651.1 hypothetical protein MMAGJ_29330 [Mycolicibacterium mageritense]CDO22079.1 hypothetical protein BN978_02544 [Mycolicibacterium mageritense DSM 44476 = CIP 104973]
MTADHALTITASTVLAVTVTALTIALATAAPREVSQSPTPTLPEMYADAWNQLKESP